MCKPRSVPIYLSSLTSTSAMFSSKLFTIHTYLNDSHILHMSWSAPAFCNCPPKANTPPNDPWPNKLHTSTELKVRNKKNCIRLHLKFIIDQFQPLHPSLLWNAEMETMQQRNQRLNMTSRDQMDIGPVDVDFPLFVSRYH